MPASLDIKILIVDDFATMRRIIKNILKQLGFNNIDEADDGVSALAKIQASKFDLIVTDWNMPNMSGLDLLKAIRANENTKAVPVLMVTAEAMKDNIVEAVKSGVTNYVVKPFTAEVMKEKLDAIFK